MRFSISHLVQNGFKLIALKDEQSATEIGVAPTFGASLHAFNILVEDKLFNIIDHYQNFNEAQKQSIVSFKSSKLSPFACRIPDGKYKINEDEFEFTNKFMDGSAIHGLLHNKAFEIVDEYADDKMASFILKYDYKKEDKGYPFHYRCAIRYLLKPNNLLTVETIISNLSETDMPLADGWHPYFRLGDNVSDCSLRFNKGDMVEFNEKLIPTGKLVKYDLFDKEKTLNDINLDNCFIPDYEQGKSICEIYNPKNKLKVSFFTDGTYPYLQIYIPGDRQSIAIENLSGAPNCFNNKMGLIMLQPHQSKTFTIQYQPTFG